MPVKRPPQKPDGFEVPKEHKHEFPELPGPETIGAPSEPVAEEPPPLHKDHPDHPDFVTAYVPESLAKAMRQG